MTFSIRATIRALAAPKHRLSCPRKVWRQGLVEIVSRGEGHHESGAFLLGYRDGIRGRVVRFAYYDDFDPTCLDLRHCGLRWSRFRTTVAALPADRTECARRLAHARWPRTGAAEPRLTGTTR